MIFLGLAYLIGGINLLSYKLWANRLVTIISGILFILIWAISIALILMFGKTMKVIVIGLINGFLWSSPLVFFIYYLNQRKIIEHFST